MFRSGRARRLIPFLVGALVSTAAVTMHSADGAVAASTVPHVSLPTTSFTLPNGLQVIFARDPHVATVSTNIWYHVGAANERPDQTGFAHLFEHMMFQGSGHIPEGKLEKLIEGTGAFFNASTSFDRTNYLIGDLPADRLELALWAESDRMGFLLDRLDAQSLANQQEVVRNERRQNWEQAPYALSDQELYAQLFPASHPYHGDVIGSHTDIQNAKLDEVRAFFKTYYVPNNATLVVAGNFDPTRAQSWITKYFGPIAKGATPPKPNITISKLTAEKDVTLTDKVDLQRVEMGWLTSPAFQPGDAAADVTATLLDNGQAGLLYRDLVRGKKIAQSVDASQYSLRYPSVFSITATAKPGHTAEELKAAIDADLAAFRDKGPSAAELQSAKNTLIAGLVRNMEKIGDFDGRADNFNRYNAYTGTPDYLQKDINRYAAIDAAAVKKFATEQLRSDARVVVDTVPGAKVLPPDPAAPPAPTDKAATVKSAEPWRNKVPGPTPAPAVQLPTIARFRLPNGLPVFLVQSHGLPVVTASLVSRYGSAQDPAGRPGLAAFVASAVKQGAGKQDADALAARVANLGADLTTKAHTEYTELTLQMLAPQAGPGVDLISQLARRASFAADGVNRVRSDMQVSVAQQKTDASTTAWKVMLRQVFGSKHPYGHLPAGTHHGLGAITAQDVKDFASRAFTPSTAALVLAGDLTPNAARSIAQKAFGDWHGSAPLPATPGAAQPATNRVSVVDMPGAAQTAIELGEVGLTRLDPDFERTQIGNRVFGSLGLSSRLNINLREKHGYTYGVYSYLGSNRGRGLFDVSGSVETSHTGDAVREILAELNRIREHNVSATELAQGKESYLGSVPGLFASTKDAAGTVAAMYSLGLPLDYYRKLAGRVQPVTAAQVRAAMVRHLDPKALRVIAVGDRAKIDAQLKALQIGDPVQLHADGTPVGATSPKAAAKKPARPKH
jgi:zinc protease